MKFSAMAVLAVLAGPVVLLAQSGGASSGTYGQMRSPTAQTGQQSTELTTQPRATLCPVSLHAQHTADGSMVRVGSRNPGYRMTGQSLYVVLQDPKSSPIVKATMTVHGYSNKVRVTQAAQSGDGSDAVRKMTIAFQTLPSGAASGNVRVPGMTAVTRIDLESVNYADGQVQQFTMQQKCQVAPDPFMLVAGR